MKYVIVEINGCEVPLMFPDCVKHDTFAEMKPIAAAKFSTIVDTSSGEPKLLYKVYGKSKSLNLKCRPTEDSDIIQHAFEFEG
jgi:hypothetical protein